MGGMMAKALQGMAYTTVKSNPNAVKFADGKYANLTDQQKMDLMAYTTERAMPGQFNVPADEIARGRILAESGAPASPTSQATMQQKQAAARRRVRAAVRPLVSPDRASGPASNITPIGADNPAKLGP